MLSNLLFLVRRWSSGRLRSNLHVLVSPWSSGWLLSNLHALMGQGDKRAFAASAGKNGTSNLGARLCSSFTASPVSSSVSGGLQ